MMSMVKIIQLAIWSIWIGGIWLTNLANIIQSSTDLFWLTSDLAYFNVLNRNGSQSQANGNMRPILVKVEKQYIELKGWCI